MQFTERQLEVLTLLAAQCDTNEIAAQLGIMPATMNYHKRNIHQKGSIKNKFVVAALAVLPAKAVTTN